MKLLIVWLCLLAWVILASGQNTTVESPKVENVSQKPIIASTVVAAPWTLRSTTDGEGLDGFIPDLLQRISRNVGVNITVKEVKDGKYGRPEDTCCPNVWSGIVGELVDKKVDIGGLLTMADARAEVITFSKPVISSSIYVITHRDQYDVYNTGVFFVMRPLSAGVWFLIIFTFIGIGALLFVFRRFSPKPPTGDAENQVEACKWDAREEFWFAFVVLMWQGAAGSPKSLASRILIGFWFGFTLLTILLYAASLVDHLSVSWPVRKPMASLSSLNDLLDQNNIQLGAVKLSTTFHLLKTGQYSHISDRMESEGTYVTDYTEGMAKVKAGNFALFLDSYTALNYLNNDCDLVKVDEVKLYSQQAFAFPQDSSIVNQVNQALDDAKQDGSFKQIYDTWFKAKQCPAPGQTPDVHVPSAVTPAMFAGPMVFIIIGIILAVLIFISEILCYKYRKQGSFTTKVDGSVEEGSLLLEDEDKLAEENAAAEVETEAAPVEKTETPETKESETTKGENEPKQGTEETQKEDDEKETSKPDEPTENQLEVSKPESHETVKPEDAAKEEPTTTTTEDKTEEKPSEPQESTKEDEQKTENKTDENKTENKTDNKGEEPKVDTTDPQAKEGEKSGDKPQNQDEIKQETVSKESEEKS